MTKLLNILFLFVSVLLVSCTQQVPSATNSASGEDHPRLDALNEQVKQLLETNKNLASLLEKQSAVLDSLKTTLNGYDNRIGKVEDQAAWQSNSLNNVIAYFASQITRQQASISNLSVQVFYLNLKSDNTEGIFDAANSTGFSRINTHSGFFLVALKDVEPYLDGYKVNLDVGNPLAATYKNLKFQVSWGKKFDINQFTNDANAYQTWSTNLHSKEISVPDDLSAGTWNKVQLVLSPAKSDELSYISIKLSTDTASLKQPFRATP
jgi:uncharacterized coiled-coil protein SlyX